MTKLVCDEKQNSDWFSQTSPNFYNIDRLIDFYLLFQHIAKENHHILSRNLFTFKFGGQTMWETKINSYFLHVSDLLRMDHAETSVHWQIKKSCYTITY